VKTFIRLRFILTLFILTLNFLLNLIVFILFLFPINVVLMNFLFIKKSLKIFFHLFDKKMQYSSTDNNKKC